MKSKTLLVLALIAAAAVILGVAIRQSGRNDWGADSSAVGKPLLPDLAINQVARVRLTGAAQQVTVVRRDGDWRVLEHYEYPANWDQVSQLVKQMATERIKQSITVGPKDYGRLNLLPPEADVPAKAGVRVELLDASGAPLGHLRFGKQHTVDTGNAPNPMMRGQSLADGRYILLESEDADGTVVLVSNAFNAVNPNPAEWIDKQFLELRNITSARLEREGETVWTLQADRESGKLTLAGEVPEGMSVKRSAVSGTARALSYASFTGAADPQLSDEETGMDNPALFHAVNDDNVACTVFIGNKSEGHYYVRADVEYREPDKTESPSSDAETGDGVPDSAAASGNGNSGEDDIRKKVRDLNKRLDGWTYRIPEQTVSRLLRTRDEFLEKEEKQAPGTAPAGNGASSTAIPGGTPPPPPPAPPVAD